MGGMRTIGTNRQVDERKQRGLELLKNGLSPAEVASRLGTTVRTVQRWRKDERDGVKRVRKKTGRPSKLTAIQLRRLARQLKRGARVHGYHDEHWTLDRIAHLIWVLFRVRYHPSSLWYVMDRMGWSSQKPRRQAIQRDDDLVAVWIESEFPRIKKVPATRRPSGSGG